SGARFVPSNNTQRINKFISARLYASLEEISMRIPLGIEPQRHRGTEKKIPRIPWSVTSEFSFSDVTFLLGIFFSVPLCLCGSILLTPKSGTCARVPARAPAGSGRSLWDAPRLRIAPSRDPATAARDQ